MRFACAAFALVALLGGAAAGCGGGGDARPVAAAAELDDGPTPDLLPPRGVPRRGDGPADPVAARVIRAWARALRRGDVERAARYFALPSRFQNATPVVTIDSPAEALAVNLSFPCGAVPVRLRGAPGGFTVVTFRLVERPGGDCGGGAGETTGGAIRVRAGRIAAWYRLYDDDDPRPNPNVSVDPGPDAA